MPESDEHHVDENVVDRHRPLVHFTADRGWINDPNGPIVLDGRYHLYFQHNPNGPHWGDISWGHAVSDDLVSWRELPVAIPAQADHLIFSGSAAVVGDGTVAAFYTGHRLHADPALVRQDQRIAISRDGGTTFEPVAWNPVIDLDLVDFRDPSVWWHALTARWVMVTVLPHERRVVVFRSSDLVTWEECSRFGPSGATDGIWECPALFEVPVVDGEGRRLDRRWVLKVDHNPGHVAGGSGGQYFVGDFDGGTFVPDDAATSSVTPNWIDWGADFYAALPFAGETVSEVAGKAVSEVPGEVGRTWIAWMSNWDYAHDTPTTPWRGAMSIPRRVTLVERGGGLVLAQRPVVGRDGDVRDRHDLTLRPTGEPIPVPDVYRLDVDVELGGASRVAVRFGMGADAEVLVSYDRLAATLTVDRSASGERPNERFSTVHRAPLDVAGRLVLDVIVDRSSIEVFADDGTVVFTEVMYPPPGERTVTVEGATGTARLLVTPLTTSAAPG